MANNSNRKAIEFMVQGALPPHSTNVLWMDTSTPQLPILKIFENGAWATVHTEQSKIDELLAKTVLAQQEEITYLTEDIINKLSEFEKFAKEETVIDFRKSLMGSNGVLRLRPLPSFMGFKQDDVYVTLINAFYERDYFESNPLGRISEYEEYGDKKGFKVHEGYTYSFPFHPEVGSISEIEELVQWYVPTVAPENVLINGEWNYEGMHLVKVDAGSKITLVEEHKYYLDPSDESTYTGSVFVYTVEDTENEKSLVDVISEIDKVNSITTNIDTKITTSVAKESTSQEIKELVLREGIILANEYAETINNIVGDFSNE